MEKPLNRCEGIWLFDCTEGAPTLIPHVNEPPTDVETGHGLVHDATMKRWIRDHILRKKALGESGMEDINIFLQHGVPMEVHQKLAFEKKPELMAMVQDWQAKKANKKKGSYPDVEKLAKPVLLKIFWDVMMFGAVLGTTDYRAGSVRGAVQFNTARTIDPVTVVRRTLTRVCRNTIERQKDIDGETDMGSKSFIHYGLYKAPFFFSPSDGQANGVQTKDLDFLFEVMCECLNHTKSSQRPNMASQGLYLFVHDSPIGTYGAPAHQLFKLINIKKKEGVEAPRSFDDYVVTIDRDKIPKGVKLIEWHLEAPAKKLAVG